jgi:hypothetical protein
MITDCKLLICPDVYKKNDVLNLHNLHGQPPLCETIGSVSFCCQDTRPTRTIDSLDQACIQCAQSFLASPLLNGYSFWLFVADVFWHANTPVIRHISNRKKLWGHFEGKEEYQAFRFFPEIFFERNEEFRYAGVAQFARSDLPVVVRLLRKCSSSFAFISNRLNVQMSDQIQDLFNYCTMPERSKPRVGTEKPKYINKKSPRWRDLSTKVALMGDIAIVPTGSFDEREVLLHFVMSNKLSLFRAATSYCQKSCSGE